MNHESENIELDLLLEAINRKYGYDFRGYARSSLTRRINQRLSLSKLSSLSHLQHEILNDEELFYTLLQDLSVSVTQMFRNPSCFQLLRDKILPQLEKHDLIKIWHPGCATGEEVYSMAIMLQEAGLYEKSLIYATDIDKVALNKAQEGVFPGNKIKEYTKNYYEAGGLRSFADYYSARYNLVRMNKSLNKNIHFSDHNLVTDGVFGEMNLIVCRNVLIYFTRELQDRVFELFRDSLHPEGHLCLGRAETTRMSVHAADFIKEEGDEKIFKLAKQE